MAQEFRFNDPHHGRELTLVTVPTNDVEVIEHQRSESPAHVAGIAASIERIGFLVPPVAVRKHQDESTRYVIIDGQHRFLAAKRLGIAEVPLIVVPSELARRMMNLNVEKSPNIRERSHVAIAVYRDFVATEPDLIEDDPQLRDSLELAYYATLGLAYESASRLAGGALQPVLSRCDGFLKERLEDAYGIRRRRAERTLEANELVAGIESKLKDLGADQQYLKPQIVAYANPLKGTRKEVDFDDAFENFVARLKKLEEDPAKLLR
jgi:hypothetical protein